MIEAVKRNGCALAYAAVELKADREIVLEAVKQDWRAFQYAAAEMWEDREIVLEAVKQDTEALSYAAKELWADREIVLEAVKQVSLWLRPSFLASFFNSLLSFFRVESTQSYHEPSC